MLQQFIVPDANVKDALLCWTAWPFLPEGRLKVTVEDNCAFMVRSCFAEIMVPSNFNESDIKFHFDMAFNFATTGFGSV
jgi:hypothetical protein